MPMSLFARAFDGVPAAFTSPLEVVAAQARLEQLKRWAPGKPLLTGRIDAQQIVLGFAPGSGYGRSRTRFEGALEATAPGCVLRGRFIGSGSARASSVLCLAVCGFMAFGGLITGLRDIAAHADSLADVVPRLLFLCLWMLLLTLFGALVLWNAAPSRSEVRDMSQHLAAALEAGDPASA